MKRGSRPPWRQRIRPVRVVRDYARRTLFRFLEKVFATDDGKRIAAEALRGLTHSPLNGLREGHQASAAPYPELGVAKEPPAARANPVFITARFRSGSTLLWNLFRHVEGCTSYYEPLNERRWFDPALRGERTDGTHRGVSDYWREYDGLQALGELYREEWTYQHLLMDESFWDPRLKRYVETLIERARGRAVLQFNRIDFRLPWFRRHFPEARLIHLYRHPRDQWCSSLMDIDSFSKDGRMEAFEPHDRFYLLAWARDLRYHFPFLDEAEVEHPYQLHYCIWKLSYLFGRKYADLSVSYESLVANPDDQLRMLFAASGVPRFDLVQLKRLIDKPSTGRWQTYADDAWFRRHETACEGVLSEFLDSPA